MLMVVFGAGASYDSFSALRPPGHEYRPPLANHLFDSRFGQFIADFPQCHAVATYLQDTGADVEQVLQNLQDQAKDYPQIEKQLAATRYYLQTMFHHTLARWATITHGLSNYKTLLFEIEHTRRVQDDVLLVSFNYDTLLEDALPTIGIRISSIDDYISTHYKVIKLHGSINWARVVNSPNFTADPSPAGRRIIHQLIDQAAELKFTSFFRLTNQYPPEWSEKPPSVPLFPALAIPVQTKQQYTCPDHHVSILAEKLPEVTKLLVIGWRAADKSFTDTLSAVISSAIPGLVVSSTPQSADQVIKTMRNAGIQANLSPASGGFSDVILNHEIEKFLRT